MGQQAAKPSRTAPARFVAKKLPRDPKAVESEFRKTQFTIQGINDAREKMYQEPRMFVETKQDENTHDGVKSKGSDVAPRWVLNSYMEMIDNSREDNTIISGNLPASWERDKFEPYGLVRNRIDEEDLHYVLSQKARDIPMHELVPQTKLERQTLQDIMDTVELPRTQYRNYKGKLHKTIEDANTFLANRKEQQDKQRERDILRQIGYSKEELAKEEQYMTNRSRGVKTLDMLGASINEKRRRGQKDKINDMEDMLEARKHQAIAEGTYEPTAEELRKPAEEDMQYKIKYTVTQKKAMKNTYALDFGHDGRSQVFMHQWLDRRKLVERAKDTIHGVPKYSEKFQSTDDEMKKILDDAAEANLTISRATGSKGFIDPRNQMDTLLHLMRNKEAAPNAGSVDVVDEDNEAQNHPTEAMPHVPNRVIKMKRSVDGILEADEKLRAGGAEEQEHDEKSDSFRESMSRADAKYEKRKAEVESIIKAKEDSARRRKLSMMGFDEAVVRTNKATDGYVQPPKHLNNIDGGAYPTDDASSQKEGGEYAEDLENAKIEMDRRRSYPQPKSLREKLEQPPKDLLYSVRRRSPPSPTEQQQQQQKTDDKKKNGGGGDQ